MENNVFETWQKWSQSAVKAVKELETINTRFLEQLTGNQMELANTAFESGSRYMNLIGEAKGVQDIIAEQGKAYTEFNETMLNSVRASTEIMVEARSAYQSWFEKGFQDFNVAPEFNFAGLKPVAKTRGKKAA